MTKSSRKATPKSQPKAAEPAPAPQAEASASSKIAKTHLIDQVADRASLTKKQAAEAVNAALDVIGEAIRGGKTVGLPGVGTFSVKATAARTGVRPGTTERIQIPAGKKVSFKVATDLKKALGAND